MFGAERVRTLMGPADPARGAAVPSPDLPAADLIALAGATAIGDRSGPRDPAVSARRRGHRTRPTRRLILVAGVIALVVGGVAAVRPLLGPDRPGHGGSGIAGSVLTPIAYQIEDRVPAAEQLRALAGWLADAPYEHSTGRYAYHRTREWGDPIMTSPGGRYVLGNASEEETWHLPDGSGRSRVMPLPPEFPDQASRDYWEPRLRALPGTSDREDPPREGPVGPLPTDRAGLAERLHASAGADAMGKRVSGLYASDVLPKRSRAQVLEVLADVPGFVWRGEVTDRSGRPGVAITYDDSAHDQQSLLVFDARTGGLLAYEIVTLKPHKVSTYLLILDTGRTDQAG